jgi:hypothetical protein
MHFSMIEKKTLTPANEIKDLPMFTTYTVKYSDQ